MTPLNTAKLYFELSNSSNLDAIEKTIHPEAIYTSDATWLYFWRESIMTMMRGFFEKFSYLHWEIQSIGEIRDWIIEIEFLCYFQESKWGNTERWKRKNHRTRWNHPIYWGNQFLNHAKNISPRFYSFYSCSLWSCLKIRPARTPSGKSHVSKVYYSFHYYASFL